MLGLTLLVASIALADSLNPSTLVPALWMATTPSRKRLPSFTLGVFAVYLAGGLVLVLGPGPALVSALHRLHGPAEHGLEAGGGVLVLAVALLIWRAHAGERERARARPPLSRGSAFALGAGIMAVELPTAFLYFGAITAILAAHRVVALELVLLFAYNALFVLPLLLLIAALRLGGSRVDGWIDSAGLRIRRLAQIALSGVAGVAGATLLTLGVRGLLVA